MTGLVTRMAGGALVGITLCFSFDPSSEFFAPIAEARDFRSANRILTPELLAAGGSVGDLAELEGLSLDGEIPIPRLHVEQALESVLDKWGSARLRETLAGDFVDADRLADTAVLLAPQDAEVRVLGISSIATLDQALRPEEGPQGSDLLLSRVTVTAQTQVEFVDRATGAFRLLRGTNDYVLLLRHRFEELAQ